MSFKKYLTVCALLAIMLVFCTGAICAEDSSNANLTSDITDVAVDEAVEEATATSDDVGEVVTADESGDKLTADSSQDVLDANDDNVIYVDGDYTGDEEGTYDKPYTLITTAISKSSADKSTIFIRNGEYAITPNYKLPTAYGISLVGESKEGVVIKGTGTSYNFMFSVKLTNFDLKFTNLTFLNPYRTVGFKVEGTGNFIVDNCLFNNFTTNIGTYTPFTVSCTGSSITNSEIINLNSGSSSGPAYMVYGPGNHKIENTLIDGFVSTYALKQGIITVKSGANLDVLNLTMSHIDAAITTGFIQVAGTLNVGDSSFKYNALKNSECLFYVDKGSLNIETSSISHNSGFKYLIKGNGGASSANINYTGIMGNAYDMDVANNLGTLNLNYNWWGTNDKPNDYVNNWVLMNLTFARNVGEVFINADFTKYTDGDSIMTLEKNLNFPIEVHSSHQTVDGEFYLKNNKVSVNFESQGDFYVDVDAGSKVTYLLGAYYVDCNYDGDEEGTQDKPFKTISAAVAKTVGWETIFIKNGNYVLDDVITLSKSVSFIGESEGGVVITGSNKGIFNNPSYLSEQLTISLTNLTFKDVECNANNAVLSIAQFVEELNILNCIFDNCTGRWGVINTECSKLYMNNTIISNTKSTSIDEGAGAIYLKGDGVFIIENTVIANSKCIGELADGIIVCKDNNALLGLSNVEIINNAISSASVISGGKLVIINSRFQNNTLKSDKKTNLIDVGFNSYIEGSIFAENVADDLIHIEGNAELSLLESEFNNNTVGNVVYIDEEGSLIVKGLTVSNSTVGNIIFADEDGSLVISALTVNNNLGESAIVLSNDSVAKITNLVVFENIFVSVIVADNNVIGVLDNLIILDNAAVDVLDIGQNTDMILNNTNIVGNNLTSVFDIFDGSELEIIGVFISANNINYVFINENGEINLEDSIISNNNCSDELIRNAGDNTNITFNYNLILDNNEEAFTNGAANYNLDYNWWGTNDKPNKFVDKWVIMDETVSREAGNAYITVYLNKFSDGATVSGLSKNVPNGVIVNVKSSTNDYNKNITINNGMATANFAVKNNKYVNITSGSASFTESLEVVTYYVDITQEGKGTGSADNPFKHISDALAVAQDGDTIIVKEGLYNENITWGKTGTNAQSKKGVNIIGENDNVVINLTSDSVVRLAVIKLEWINLTFIGNGANMYVETSNSLNAVNCTFDGLAYGYLMTTRGLFYNNGVTSNIENCKFMNSVLSEKAITVGFIAQYSNSGNHVIKNCLFDNLTHTASSASTYTRGIIYVGTNKVTLDVDNITITNAYIDAECLIGNGASYTTLPGGILTVKNSRFINNTVHRYKIGTTEYAGSSLFYNTKGVLTVETSVIVNNTGSLYLIYNRDAASDSIFNYNAIYNNVFTTDIATTTGKHDMDYNWWNSTTPAYADANAWIVLDAYSSPEKIVAGDDAVIVGTFNHYITKDGVRGDTNHIIPFDSDITFIFPDGTNLTVASYDGEASVLYSQITGNETFIIQSNGQERLFSVKLNAMRIDLDDEIIVGENTTVRVLAPGITGNVTLIIDGVKEILEIVDGVASKTIENIQAGGHSVVAIFNGDAEHGFEYDSKTFTVDKFSTEINLDDITVNVGEDVPIAFTIAANATGKVFFDINGRKFFQYLEDGSIDTIIDKLEIGNYTVTVSYEGDDKYLPSEDTFQITVNGLNAGLKANTTDIKVGEVAVIDIEINENVTGDTRVYINNEVIPVVFTNGKASVSIEDLPADTYPVVVKFLGDDKFLPEEIELTIVVSKDEIPDDMKNVTMDIPEGTTSPEFSISLPSDATGNFTVTVDGTDYTEPLVNGSATVKVPDLSVGDHTISTSYSGDDKYDGFTSDNKTVNIPKASIPGGENAISMDTPSDSATPSYTIKLPSDATGNLTATVDGKNTYSQPLVNGTATVNVPKLDAGKHTIVVSYSGDAKYSGISKTTTVNVPAPVIKLTENKDVTMLYTAKSPYKVRVTVDGKPVGAGEVVTIKFNGKTYSVKTDANGYATLKLPNVKPKKAKYTITAEYKGVKVTNKVKVNSVIKAKNAKVKKSKKVNKIKVTLKKVNGKYLKGKKLTLKIKGKKIKAKTNKKGVATFKVKKNVLKKLKAGKKYKYTVTYGKDVVTKKLTVKK